MIAAEPNKVGIQVHKGKPGIFGDRVWYDTDQDGIQDEGEGGVDGIIVKLFSPTVPGIRNPATDEMITFTITGNGGYYLFSNLPEGDYYAVYLLPNSPVLSVLHAPGSTSETDSDGEATNVNGVDAAITAITHILSTETDLSWDLGVYCPSFAPAVSMPQTVWSGTNITLSASGGSSYTWSGPGGFTATGSTINIPSVAAADTGLYQVTIIQSGCFATLNTSLSIFAGSSIGNYVWNDANGNGVQDLGEAGMSGVTAKLYTSTDSLVMTKQSDNNGAYSFENINPGIYYLHFQAPSGYAFTASLNAGDNQDDTNSDANPMSGQTLPFTLSAGEFDRTKDAGLISSIVTPVTLLSFTAEKNGKEALIKWKTEKEIDLSYFDIERSQPLQPFKSLGRVSAQDLGIYQFKDASPASGINLYRLRMVDRDGSFQYSSTASLSFDDKKPVFVYPNPVATMLHIRMPAEQIGKSILIELFNPLGQRVLGENIKAAEMIESIPVEDYAPGVYTIRIRQADQNPFVEQIQIKR